MTQIDRQLVAENFSRRSTAYDQAASFQRYAADKFFEFATQKTASKQPKKILELGCGTGFLTEKIMSRFPHAQFSICDISPKMIAKCSDNTERIRRKFNILATLKCLDIEEAFDGEKYDLIVSGLAFQWIDNLPSVIDNARNKLAPEGTLIFSSLTQGTFGKLKDVFRQLDSEYPGPDLRSVEEIRNMCASFKNVDIVTEAYQDKFDSPLAFLKNIQMTGAGNATGKTISAGILKKALNIYPMDENGKVTAEYKLLICAAQ